MSGARNNLRGLWLLAVYAALGACTARLGAWAANPTYAADAVMAAFLYRFGGFVRWPPGAMSSPHFTIDVLGDDRVAGDLERMLPGLTVQGRPAAVHRIRSVRELGSAQILYIGPHDERTLRSALTAVGNRPVLVVTDQPGALDAGSMINFILIGGHVRFDISVAAARHSNLRLSSELLSVAMRVEGGPLGRLGACPPAVSAGALAFSCRQWLAAR